MAKLDDLMEELVTANRILAREGVVDSFGHISVRHPDNPQRYLLSRSRAPDCIERDDIMEFTLDGTPVDPRGRAPYLERFIHGALYEARPDVMSVVHNHSESVIPFGVTGKKIKPIFHMGASIGHEVPVWDSHDRFGDTALLVENMDMGRDLAKRIGAGGTALMRGHGATVAGKNIRHAVYISVYLEVNARLQKQAMDMGEVKFLTAGAVGKGFARTRPFGIHRGWGKKGPGAGQPIPAVQRWTLSGSTQRQSWRIGGCDRSIRLRQVDLVHCHRGIARRLRCQGQGRRRAGARAAPGERHDFPGGVDLSLAQRARKCGVSAGDRGHATGRALRQGPPFREAGWPRWLRAALSGGAVGWHAPARVDGAHAGRAAQNPPDGPAI